MGTRPGSLPGRGSRTTTGATWCSHCWPNGRVARGTTSWCAPWSASLPDWWTPRSCAPTSPWSRGPGLPRGRRPADQRVPPPVLGNGDGGIYSTAADLSAFWTSLFAGRIVSPERVADMVRPRSDWPEEDRRYGLWGSTSTRPARESGSRGTTPACRSPAGTSRRQPHVHRHLELVGGRLADHQAARRPARQLTHANPPARNPERAMASSRPRE